MLKEEKVKDIGAGIGNIPRTCAEDRSYNVTEELTQKFLKMKPFTKKGAHAGDHMMSLTE
jgi:2-polyprenyl-3-methyl-5-hydroxy-6-metoxy-1,4-benzoquinol methylase